MSSIKFGSNGTEAANKVFNITFTDYSYAYKSLQPILQRIALEESKNIGSDIVKLDSSQLISFREALKEELSRLIDINKNSNKQGNVGVIMEILGEQVNLKLKESNDKLIHTFWRLYEIVNMHVEHGVDFFISQADD